MYLFLSGLLALSVVFLYGRKKEPKKDQELSLLTPPLYDKALAWFVNEEGLKLKPYPDGRGFSIGIGHQIQDNEKSLMNGITKEVAIRIFNRDLKNVDDTLKRLVKVPINNNQKLALASLVFNIGPGAFEGSTVLKELNNYNYNRASLLFSEWNKSTDQFGVKRINPTLTQRRSREQQLFRTV